MAKIRIGIVGTGFIADWHYQGFLKNPDAVVTAIARDFYGDENQKEKQHAYLNEKAEEFGIKAYPDFDTLLNSDNIDALVIGSINPLHYDQIKKAIASNKPILVEKPVLTDFKELSEIEKLCAEKNFKLFPAHNFVYRGAVQKARQFIDDGKLGDIIHASFVITHTISEKHAHGWRAVKSQSAGGALMDSGHHLVYQALYLLGTPNKLHGFTAKRVLTNMDGEDTAQVSLFYPDDSIACIMQSWTSDHADNINGIRIIGTEGSLVISDALYLNGEKANADTDYGDSFINQAKAFTEYILNDTPPISDLKDVRNTLKIIYGAYESAEKNKVIEL